MPRRTLLRALSIVSGLALVAGSGASAVGAQTPPGLPDTCAQPSTGLVPEECWSAPASARPTARADAGGSDVTIAPGNAYVDGLTDAGALNADQLTFPPGDMARPEVLKAEKGAGTVLGYDFSRNGSVLYGVDNTASTLITVNQTTGKHTTVGPMTKPATENWIDLVVNPATGAAYAASASPQSYSLFSLDLSTGATTLINTLVTGAVPIDLSMNCAGEMYAETSFDDMLDRVDPATGALTVVGPLGVDLNFAQGMDFDNATGVLHAWQVKNDLTTQYASIDRATGTSTRFRGGSPPGEYEGAIKSACPDCPALKASVQKASRQLAKAKKKLKAAQKRGNPKAVARAKKNLKKAKKKLKKAKAALAAAAICT